MAKVLLIETATEICSVAIAVDRECVAVEEISEPNQHATVLADLVRSCSEAAGIPLNALDAVVVSKGPGSYTSLRVGASTAKGIAYALGIPLIGVDTLQALACGMSSVAPGDTDVHFLPMLDARRNEVWTALYDQNGVQQLPAQPVVLENGLFEDFSEKLSRFSSAEKLVLGGSGMHKAGPVGFFEPSARSECVNTSAKYLISPAFDKLIHRDFEDVAYFEPAYMKPPNITVSRKQKF